MSVVAVELVVRPETVGQRQSFPSVALLANRETLARNVRSIAATRLERMFGMVEKFECLEK